MYGIEVIAQPTITDPAVADLAAHLGLGDLYDAADAAAVLSAAAAIASDLTGWSVGSTRYRLTCRHIQTSPSVLLPKPSPSFAIDDVRVDGAVVPSADYELVQDGPWRALKWLTAPAGERLAVTFTSGETALKNPLRALALIIAGDLYRSRESQTPGAMSPSSLTAQWLAGLQRVHYPGPYADFGDIK